MTKSTFNTLWFTGGGLLATWFAVAPTTPQPVGMRAPQAATTAAVRETTAADLNAEETKLRQHLTAIPLRPSTRNLFRFGAKAAARGGTTRELPSAGNSSPAALVTPVGTPASFTLSGIAERKGPQGPVRTAIIAGDAELYLVTEGESVGSRYHVVRVDSDAVVLRDDTGAETRMVLR